MLYIFPERWMLGSAVVCSALLCRAGTHRLESWEVCSYLILTQLLAVPGSDTPHRHTDAALLLDSMDNGQCTQHRHHHYGQHGLCLGPTACSSCRGRGIIVQSAYHYGYGGVGPRAECIITAVSIYNLSSSIFIDQRTPRSMWNICSNIIQHHEDIVLCL